MALTQTGYGPGIGSRVEMWHFMASRMMSALKRQTPDALCILAAAFWAARSFRSSSPCSWPSSMCLSRRVSQAARNDPERASLASNEGKSVQGGEQPRGGCVLVLSRGAGSDLEIPRMAGMRFGLTAEKEGDNGGFCEEIIAFVANPVSSCFFASPSRAHKLPCHQSSGPFQLRFDVAIRLTESLDPGQFRFMKETSEADDRIVLAKAGLDSLIYLHILQALLTLFTVSVRVRMQQTHAYARNRGGMRVRQRLLRESCWGWQVLGALGVLVLLPLNIYSARDPWVSPDSFLLSTANGFSDPSRE
eukprot:2982580-Rhodomonas_salina.3